MSRNNDEDRNPLKVKKRTDDFNDLDLLDKGVSDRIVLAEKSSKVASSKDRVASLIASFS